MGDPALQALAAVFPNRPIVPNAWSQLRGASRFADLDGVRTYLAVAYAAADPGEVVDLLERHMRS